MGVGSKVLYKNKEYIIVWDYKNGFYEIGEARNNNKVELVRTSDLIEIEKGSL